MNDQPYYLVTPTIEGVQLVQGGMGISYQNYPPGAPVTVLTLAHAMALVMSGEFAWYGPAPAE